MLPQRAVARIFFPSHSELREHIPSESLLEGMLSTAVNLRQLLLDP